MPCTVHSHRQCSHAHHQETTSTRLLHLLEKISAIALGIFSAYASLELFLPFFLGGVAVGLYQHFSAEGDEEGPLRASACSQGFLEQLTHVKLPPLISLGVNLAITWCHIDHHTTIFVPVVALSTGAWAGQSMGRFASWT